MVARYDVIVACRSLCWKNYHFVSIGHILRKSWMEGSVHVISHHVQNVY